MGRLIVHIGTHKTATTTLQRHLARNREALAARGIWYPDYGLIGKGAHYAHLGMVNALAGQHEKFSVEDATRFFREVVARVPDHAATILSAEPFYRHIAYRRTGAVPAEPERYWPLRTEYVARVHDLFAGPAPEIVVVFRRQADYAHSLYQEHIKTTRYHEDFRTFRAAFWYHFDYLGQARAWADAFGGLTALRFEDLVAGGDPVAAFGAHLQLNLSGPETVAVAQQNVALHPDAVVLKRLLHATKADKDAIRTDIEAVLNGPLSRRIRKFKNRSLYADAADLHDFQAGFDAGNEALRRAFFPGVPGPLFPADVPDNLRFGDALHPLFLSMLLQGLSTRHAKDTI